MTDQRHQIEGIALGDIAKDTITGFQGAVVGICHYLTGCSQLLLAPTDLTKDGDKREVHWFDIERVVGANMKLGALPARDRVPSGGPATETAPRRQY